MSYNLAIAVRPSEPKARVQRDRAFFAKQKSGGVSSWCRYIYIFPEYSFFNMIKLQSMKEQDIRKILKIITDIDKEDGFFARKYFSFYFDKKTSEHKFARMFKIIYDKEIIGCVGYAQKWGDDVYEVIWMYLNKDIHSKGIGSLVLKEIETKLAKKHARLLVVETGRQRAIKFYKKNRFVMKGKIEDLYRKNEHSWLLSKKVEKKAP